MQELDTKSQISNIQSSQPDTEIRICRRAIPDETILHQGDVYLVRVPDDHPKGEKIGTRQVAIGTTVGARHVVEGENIEVYSGMKYPKGFTEPIWVDKDSLLGPVIVVSGKSATLTHPEHAYHQFPKGTWQVTYQADMSTNRAVLD